MIIKTLFSDVRQAIVGGLVLAVFGSIGGILYLSKAALSFSIAIVNTPTPLWASIALVLLLGLYIWLTLKKFHESSHSSTKKPIKNNPEFIFHNNLLWLPNDNSPFCPACYEINNKQIHVKKLSASNNYDEWDYYECHNCEYRADFSEHPKDNKSFHIDH